MAAEQKPPEPTQCFCGRRAAEAICTVCGLPRWESERKVNTYANVMIKRDKGDDSA